MAHQAPFPSLRFLKQKAKHLTKAYADGDPVAERFVAKHWQSAPAPTALTLAGAYRTLAHSVLCRDWTRLKNYVELLVRTQREGVEACSPAELDDFVEMMGLAYPYSHWAHQFVSSAGEAGRAAAIRGLTHANPRVRVGASQYLDHHVTDWDGQTFDALTRAATDEAPRVRAAVLHALSCQRCKADPLDEPAIDLLIESLGDPSATVRRTAAAGLWSFRDRPRVRSAFLEVLGDDNRGVRQHAVASLARWSGDREVVGALVSRLELETNDRVIRALLSSLRETQSPLRGLSRDEIEARLGRPSDVRRGPSGPLTCCFPISRLTEHLLPGLDDAFFLRVFFDDLERATSVVVYEAVAERLP